MIEYDLRFFLLVLHAPEAAKRIDDDDLNEKKNIMADVSLKN